MAEYDGAAAAGTVPRKGLPETYEALRAAVLSRRDSFPRRVAQAAAYCLDHPDEIAFGTAASIASSAGVQPSTLIRFAQQLGFDGFTSLQAVFRGRLRERHASYEDRLNALRANTGGENGHRALLDGFLAAANASLGDLSSGLDERRLEAAIDTLVRAETIFVLARRRSYPVASYVAYALGKLGIRNQLVESAAGMSPELISFATSRDALLAISFSPYAEATIGEARSLHQNGVPVVAITDSAFSPLAQSANIWFEVAEADFAGFRSLAASMTLAMTLCVGVAEQRHEGKRVGSGINIPT